MSVDATRYVWKLPKSAVSPLEKLILLAIADRCGEAGECWPSVARICKDTNLSEDAVRKHRQILLKKGILKYTGMFMGRSKQIPVMKLMVDEWREGTPGEDEIDPPPPTTPSSQRGVKNDGLPPRTGRGYPPPGNTQNLKEEPKQKNIYISGSFEEFWKLYPKKKAKDTCKAKWKAKKLDKIGNEIIEKLKEQIESDDEWRQGFIPNPMTYINQSRWKDEICKPRPTTQNPLPKTPTAKSDDTLFSMFLGGIATDVKLGIIEPVPPISFEEWKSNNYGEDHRPYLKKLNIKIGVNARKP